MIVMMRMTMMVTRTITETNMYWPSDEVILTISLSLSLDESVPLIEMSSVLVSMS